MLIVRIGLTLGSYRLVLRWIERYARPSRRPTAVLVLVWSVRHSAKLVPGASCLTQALAMRYLMLRAGEGCTIRIGVRETANRPFDAHAWVMYQGRVLIGGNEQDLAAFKPLVDL
ncbi:lasso peptide biosynthesis B2 protein [Sphingomonas qomolangmaensis]|uniref:Lasso peptide biosynthesis B2 protein n=1 Tax=Sphingomonas qomolangmaensis TaxID=2918765 RepID=A0ABY5L9I2_9SPHN|nr:lasso peptide biosynthesis B2 protein [Sphingomonas qomolangmaensis]UUL82379.1 lasso peptide biosynthesis B2 protein [Sphingomonas qomolangmaensis]